MIPYSFLPESVQRISRLLPATLVMNAFNGLAMGDVLILGLVALLPYLLQVILN